MSILSSLLPDVVSLHTSVNEKVSVSEALRGKQVIGIYFGAQWNLTCRGVTHLLESIYTTLRQQDSCALEIIYVSADETNEKFMSYYTTMKWCALPYDKKLLSTISKLYLHDTYPHLVFIDITTGSILSENGIDLISTYGVLGFPYTESKLTPMLAQNAKIEQTNAIVKTLSSWNLYSNEIATSLKSDLFSISILIGNGKECEDIISQVKLVFTSPNIQSKCKMIYIPHEVFHQESEKAFQASLPSEWLICHDSTRIILSLRRRSGAIKTPILYVISGEKRKSQMFTEDGLIQVLYSIYCIYYIYCI
jgi:nucleoredoxin